METHSSILVGKFHGQSCLVGYSPWGRKESDTTVVGARNADSNDLAHTQTLPVPPPPATCHTGF